MRPIFKTEMLICPSNADLNEKILSGEITYHLDIEIMQMPAMEHVWEQGTVHSGP